MAARHERIRLVISSSLRLLKVFIPLSGGGGGREGCRRVASTARLRRLRPASKRRQHRRQVVASAIIVCALSPLFVSPRMQPRDIKRQFKDDWTMTHDTRAIGRTAAFSAPSSVAVSSFCFFCFLSFFLLAASCSYRPVVSSFLSFSPTVARRTGGVSFWDPLTSNGICQSASPSGPAR